MIPADFRFYDFLRCAATAIAEAGAGRPAEAETAWLEAHLAASGLFAPASAANVAAGMILDAAGPVRGYGGGCGSLRDALEAAAVAVLPAMAGETDSTGGLLPDAFDAAALLPAGLRGAVTVILAEIAALARTQGEVTA